MPEPRDTVLLVGAGLLQLPAIDVAHGLGFRVAITDRNPDAVGFGPADESYVLDTKDVEGHVALARRLTADGRLAAVFTEGADVEVTVAEAAYAVGLPGVDPAAARLANDKAAFRRRCAEADLPHPRFVEVDSAADARRALLHVGLPAIVKPVDNSGSRGTVKIADADAISAAFAEAKRWSSTGTVLVEQCLVGPEQSVETIVAAGVHHRLNVVDRPFAFDPYPIELGHDNPSLLPQDKQDALFDLVERTARAIGIDLGAAKADTMWTQDGPMVIEMTARLSGGFHSQATTPLAHGTKEIKAVLDLALGRELDPADVTPTHARHSICRSLFPRPGIIVSVDGVDEALACDGVEHVFMRLEPGDEIAEYKTCVDRPVFVVTVGDTHAEALAAFETAQELIQIRTEPARATA
jgi:biotin carboxylase